MAFFPNLQAGAAVVADASGTWGCGAYTRDSLDWFQLPWPAAWVQTSIAAKELLPLVVAAALWGRAWHGTRVQFISDNQAVVGVLNTRSARDPQLMHLLRCLFFFQALFRFELRAEHVPGRQNAAADALSRNRVELFRSLFPQAPATPTPIPVPLVEMLLDHTLNWTSPRWRSLLRGCLSEVWPRHLSGPTHPGSPDT